MGVAACVVPGLWPGHHVLVALAVGWILGPVVVLLPPGRPLRWYDYILMCFVFAAVAGALRSCPVPGSLSATSGLSDDES